jgi:hypothetical protein
MPEAFSSIADMRIVIDSSTDKLDAGLTAAKNLVTRFASEGSSSLSLFDRAVGKTADGIETLKTRAGIILASIEYALSLYKSIEPYLEQAARETGTEQQLTQTKDAALDLANALYEGTGTAWNFVAGKTKDATEALVGYSDATRESSKAQAINIDAAYLNAYALQKLTEHMKDASTWLRSFEAPEHQSWDTLLYSIEKAEKKLTDIKEKLAHPDRGASFFEWLFGSDLEMQKRQTEFDLIVDRMMLSMEKFAAVSSWKTTVDTSDQDSFLEKIEKQVSGLELRAQTVGMNSTAAAEYIHKAELMNELDDKNIGLTQEQKEQLDGLIERWNKATEAIDGNAEAKRKSQLAERDSNNFDQTIAGLARQTAQVRARTAALLDASEAGRVQAIIDQQLVALEARHIELTPQRIAAIRAQAEAQVEASMEMEETQRRLKLIGDVGNAVTSNLDSAFRRWTNGSKVSVKEMAASILADLAEIQFKAAVLNPLANFLSGSQSGGGGILGSLLGIGSSSMPSASSWTAGTSIIPAFADGGDFGPGPMWVGERGPELIWPTFPGKVIPNNALPNAAAASGPPVINMPVTINAQGAYPESIADIKAALAETQAAIPQTAVAAWQEAKDRGVV